MEPSQDNTDTVLVKLACTTKQWGYCSFQNWSSFPFNYE